MGKLLNILLALVAVCCITCCNTSGCLDNGSAIPLAGFYGSDGKSISLDSINIHGVGAPGDSAVIAVGKSASQIYLPMRSTANRTTWVIAYKQKELDYPELNDTLVIDYQSIPYFASEECGAMYKYRVTDFGYTTHLVDSIKVDSVITNADIETIKIYFRTAQEGEEQ